MKILLQSMVTVLMLAGCGGGGGGSDSTPTTDGPTPGVGNGSGRWEALADLKVDGCRERISDVRQIFTVDNGAIDTGIVTVPTTDTDSGFTFGFDETNGNCARHYVGEFSNVTATTANVTLSSTSNCGGGTCENQWAGTATLLAN